MNTNSCFFTAMKHWIAPAVNSLKISLGPIAQESNELDRKQSLSPNKGRWDRIDRSWCSAPHSAPGRIAIPI